MQGGKGGDAPQLKEEELVEGGLPDLHLGDHFLIGLGVIVCPWTSGRHAAEAELSGGFASWSSGRDSEPNRLTTFGVPLDLLAFYRYRLSADGGIPLFLRGGAGATYHAAWGVGSYGAYSGINYDLDDAFGAVIEASAVYGVVGAGLRYTRISSQFSGSDESLDMSSIAAFVSIIVEPGLAM